MYVALTENSQIDFRLKRCLRHDVACLAAESRLVVARLRGEAVDVLRQPARGSAKDGDKEEERKKREYVNELQCKGGHVVVPVGHADLGTVLVPDELGGRITTATATDELHALTASQCIARRVALDVWRTWWICERKKKQKQYVDNG